VSVAKKSRLTFMARSGYVVLKQTGFKNFLQQNAERSDQNEVLQKFGRGA
jgi:hypothetical protein